MKSATIVLASKDQDKLFDRIQEIQTSCPMVPLDDDNMVVITAMSANSDIIKVSDVVESVLMTSLLDSHDRAACALTMIQCNELSDCNEQLKNWDLRFSNGNLKDIQ